MAAAVGGGEDCEGRGRRGWRAAGRERLLGRGTGTRRHRLGRSFCYFDVDGYDDGDDYSG